MFASPSLSPSALQRLAHARTLPARTPVQVFDDRLGLPREGLLLENRMGDALEPHLLVLFRLPGRQDRVRYEPADFERFEVTRAA